MFVGVIFAVVGAGLLLGWANGQRHVRQFRKGALDAEGVVVRNREHRRSGSNRSDTVRPVVRFTTAAGEAVEFEDGVGTSWAAFQEGATVPVRYHPESPKDARIATSFRESGGNVVFLLFGGAFVVIGLVVMAIDAVA